VGKVEKMEMRTIQERKTEGGILFACNLLSGAQFHKTRGRGGEGRKGEQGDLPSGIVDEGAKICFWKGSVREGPCSGVKEGAREFSKRSAPGERSKFG